MAPRVHGTGPNRVPRNTGRSRVQRRPPCCRNVAHGKTIVERLAGRMFGATLIAATPAAAAEVCSIQVRAVSAADKAEAEATYNMLFGVGTGQANARGNLR